MNWGSAMIDPNGDRCLRGKRFLVRDSLPRLLQAGRQRERLSQWFWFRPMWQTGRPHFRVCLLDIVGHAAQFDGGLGKIINDIRGEGIAVARFSDAAYVDKVLPTEFAFEF